MARKKPGAYAPLSAHYADDDRIMAAGEDAELLYLRALAYCARTPKTEGHLTHAQVKTRLGLDGAESRAETCAEVGLLVRTDSGYRIASWLKWNLSAEEVERVRSQDRHRKAIPLTSAKSGSGSGNGSGSEGVTDAGIRVPYTDTETDTETRSSSRKRAATSSDPLFDDFWAAYPRKTDKGNARKAWDKALKKTTAETLIRAAGALAAAKPDPKFTAHPSTWLNGERWDDQPLTLLPGGMKADGSRSQYAADDVRNRFK